MIAGHKRPGNDDSPKIIEETRQYIRDFDRVAGTATTALGLYDKMVELYPDRVNPGGAFGAPSKADHGRDRSVEGTVQVFTGSRTLGALLT